MSQQRPERESSPATDPNSVHPIAAQAFDRTGIVPGFPSAALDAGLAAAYAPTSAASADHSQVESSGWFYKPGQLVAERYRLVERIGEGGMGLVWRAEQTLPLQRSVALKLIKPGFDSQNLLMRFDVERQVLAMMDHPHIARVFDADVTAHGQPFFVMELVGGTALTTWCDQHCLSVRERLNLLILVCQAIHHAHQKGIIHRDIKPSNVMVTMVDGQPVPKVIDFGVAKAIDEERGNVTLCTALGALIGTIEYMSPEQADLGNRDIDIRSDVYSLGVLAYELLVGATPVSRAEHPQASLSEMLRLIREVDPRRPSQQLAGSPQRAEIAKARAVESESLVKLLQTDLDWIVLKALEKNRARRYESAAALAADLQRFLLREPVLARPPSFAYCAGKFIDRYRWQVAAASLVWVTMLAAVIGTGWGLFRAESQRRNAERARQAANARAEGERLAKLDAQRQQRLAEEAEDATLASYRASTDLTIERLIGARSTLGPAEREFLLQTLQRWQVFANRQSSDQRSRAIRAEGLSRTAKIWKRLGEADQAIAGFEQALPLWQSLAESDGEADWRRDYALCHNDFAGLQGEIGNLALAERHCREAIQIQAALVAEFPEHVDDQWRLFSYRTTLGNLLLVATPMQASRELEIAKQISQQVVQRAPTVPEYLVGHAIALDQLASAYQKCGRYQDAKVQYQEALKWLESATAEHSNPFFRFNLATTQLHYFELLFDLNNVGEAEQVGRQALAHLESLTTTYPAVPQYRSQLAISHRLLASLLIAVNRVGEAGVHAAKGAAIDASVLETYPSKPQYRAALASAHYVYALYLAGRNERERVLDPLRDAQQLQTALVAEFPHEPTYRQNLAATENRMGLAWQAVSNLPAAEQAFRRAIELNTALAEEFPENSQFRVEAGGCYCNLGILLRDSQRLADGLACFDTALDLLQPMAQQVPARKQVHQYLRATHWARGRASTLAGSFSAHDWERAVELAADDRKPAMRLRRWASQYQAGEQRSAVAATLSSDAAADLERVNASDLTDEEWYVLATVHAAAAQQNGDRHGEFADRATHLLQLAIQQGFHDRQRLERDSQFDSIRGQAAFLMLLEQIDASRQ